MKVDYEVGDTVVRKEEQRDPYWSMRCKQEGLSPGDPLTVTSLHNFGVAFIEKEGSWEPWRFEKATDFTSLSDWI
jgi:hypothetical protein